MGGNLERALWLSDVMAWKEGGMAHLVLFPLDQCPPHSLVVDERIVLFL
jgi:hypothetical protein